MRTAVTFATPILFAAGLAGCGAASDAGSKANGQQGKAHEAAVRLPASHVPVARPVRPLSARGARVVVLSPKPNQQVGRRFSVRVAVSGFVLEGRASGTTPAPRRGHMHFLLDGGRFDQPQFSGANGRLAEAMAVNGYYSPAYRPEIVYSHVPPGRHTLTVELVDRNEGFTGVSSSVSFVVR